MLQSPTQTFLLLGNNMKFSRRNVILGGAGLFGLGLSPTIARATSLPTITDRYFVFAYLLGLG